MLISRVAGTVTEPVTLSEAKAHLRVLHSAEDTLIGGLVTAAREHAEQITGRSLAQKTYDAWWPAFPASGTILLPRPPVASVTGVYYLPVSGGDATQLDAAYFDTLLEDVDAPVIKLKSGQSWPSTATGDKAVRVRFVAGGITEEHVSLLHAIKLLIEHLYHNRGVTSDGKLDAVPRAFSALVAPHKLHGWI